MNFVHMVRALIYLSLVAAVIFITLQPYLYATQSEDSIEDVVQENVFWPPDMIPHPMPPGSGPEWEQEPGPKEA